MSGRVWRRLCIACVVVVAGTTGCSAAPVDGGPVSFGGPVGQNCLPAGSSSDLTYGFEGVGNPTGDPVEVTGVALVNAHHVTLAGSYLLPVRHHVLIGNVNQWPPDTAESRPVWGQRQPAIGASIPPGSGRGDDRNLVLHLQLEPVSPAGSPSEPSRQGPVATFDGVSLTYVAAGTTYTRSTSVGFVVRDRC